jgi:two-component system, OmpR family, sensor histidine kinase CpxA
VTVTLARQGDELAEIFRPFYRIEEARDRQSGGSGLAITEQTLRRHNGSVSARNHETVGLAISIYLPVKPALERYQLAAR